MNNLMDIQSQIAKLQKQAAEIKAREFDRTVQEILATMQAFGITVKDLAPGPRRGARTSPKASGPGKRRAATGRKTGATVPPKYRGPQGETWSGRGVMPRWLAALVAQGRVKEDFLIKD